MNAVHMTGWRMLPTAPGAKPMPTPQTDLTITLTVDQQEDLHTILRDAHTTNLTLIRRYPHSKRFRTLHATAMRLCTLIHFKPYQAKTLTEADAQKNLEQGREP